MQHKDIFDFRIKLKKNIWMPFNDNSIQLMKRKHIADIFLITCHFLLALNHYNLKFVYLRSDKLNITNSILNSIRLYLENSKTEKN